eukprot:6459610-Amphidinium_carterae.1
MASPCVQLPFVIREGYGGGRTQIPVRMLRLVQKRESYVMENAIATKMNIVAMVRAVVWGTCVRQPASDPWGALSGWGGDQCWAQSALRLIALGRKFYRPSITDGRVLFMHLCARVESASPLRSSEDGEDSRHHAIMRSTCIVGLCVAPFCRLVISAGHSCLIVYCGSLKHQPSRSHVCWLSLTSLVLCRSGVWQVVAEEVHHVRRLYGRVFHESLEGKMLEMMKMKQH